jgi:serine/threonine-protein kinase RsbW
MTLMTLNGANRTRDAQLTLGSQIEDLSRVAPWIESVAAEYAIPTDIQFAMNLCLEEVLSNIIRHGYSSEPGHSILIRYVPNRDKTSFLIVDDDAPHFDPLAREDTPVEETLEGIRIGGLGIRLVRNFASSLRYEATPTGNRLIVGFAAAQ